MNRRRPNRASWRLAFRRRGVRDGALAVVLVASGAVGFAGCGSSGASTSDAPVTDTPPAQAGQPPGQGSGGPSTASPDPSGAGDCVEPACLNVPLPPSPHAVRLTHAQWENTVRDLLRLPAAPGLSVSFVADPAPPAGQFGRDGGSLVVTNALWQDYQRAAEALADLVATDGAAMARVLPAAANAGDTAARVTAFVQDFLPRAYRRPVTAAEVAGVVAFASSVNPAASDTVITDEFVLRARWVIAAVLQSPHFLYRVEGGVGDPVNGRVRLGPYELASKLSYALWRTMPDDKLVGYAASGKLATNDGVAAVVKEMLADGRVEATLVDFHDQLFTVAAYAGVDRDTKLFPTFYAGLGKDAQEDVRRTIRDLVIQGAGGVKDLYGSPEAFVNASLARVYGIDPAGVGLAGNPGTFVKVQMPAPRAGILSHVGWLAMEGKAKDPATILRGVYLARHVLCLPLGSPPPAAAGKDPSQIDAPTNRQRVTGITAGCGDGCHGGAGGVINPLGFAFEEFDASGAYRTTDATLPIDSTGAIDAVGSFTDAASLMTKVGENPRTHACYAAHWNAYLNGTTELKVTPKWLSPIIASSMKGASVRDIIAALVQTDAFLTVSR